MQLNKFKLMKEDADSYHLQHPKGRTLQVLKGGLSEKAHSQIKKLKSESASGFAKGGEITVEQEKEPIVIDMGGDRAPASDAAPQKDPYGRSAEAIEGDLKQAKKVALDKEELQGEEEMAGLEAQESLDANKAMIDKRALTQTSGHEAAPINPQIENIAPQAPMANAGQPLAPAPQAPANPMQAYNPENALTQEQNAIRSAAKAEAESGKKQAQAYDEFNNKLSQMQTPQQITDAYKAKDDSLMKAYMEEKINPERYWENKSTGSKVLAGIGMVLSGIGSGLTGQSNMAMDNIHRAIDADIEAQKNQQGKTKTLWEMNQKALGNDIAANLATQNQLLTGVQARVKMAEAQAMGPMAQAKAQQMIAEIEQKKMANRIKMTAIQMGKNGGAANSDPAPLVQVLVPPEHQKEVFKEIQTAQNTRHMAQSINEAFEQAVKENTALKTGFGLIRTPGSVYALHQAMQPTFQDLEGTVRQAAMDNTFKNITPAPGDSEYTISQKRKAKDEYLQSKAAAPTAKGFGIDLGNFESTTSSPHTQQERKYLDWAKANPNDPRAQLVMKKLGEK